MIKEIIKIVNIQKKRTCKYMKTPKLCIYVHRDGFNFTITHFSLQYAISAKIRDGMI